MNRIICLLMIPDPGIGENVFTSVAEPGSEPQGAASFGWSLQRDAAPEHGYLFGYVTKKLKFSRYSLLVLCLLSVCINMYVFKHRNSFIYKDSNLFCSVSM
jgi:hypothetical protein